MLDVIIRLVLLVVLLLGAWVFWMIVADEFRSWHNDRKRENASKKQWDKFNAKMEGFRNDFR